VLRPTLLSGILTLACTTQALAAPPAVSAADNPFRLVGANADAYEGVLAGAAGYPRTSIELRSTRAVARGSAAYLTKVDAAAFRGKRVRLRAVARTGDLHGTRAWAGLWLRAERREQAVAFNDMRDRPIRGTRADRSESVVLDVPMDADVIVYGVHLVGKGSIRASDLTLEVVDDAVPVSLDLAPGATALDPSDPFLHPDKPAVVAALDSAVDLNASGMFLFSFGGVVAVAPLRYGSEGPRALGLGLSVAGIATAGLGVGLLVAGGTRLKRPGFWLAKGNRYDRMAARAHRRGWTPPDSVDPSRVGTGRRRFYSGLLALSFSGPLLASGVIAAPVAPRASAVFGALGAGLLGAGAALVVVGKRGMLGATQRRVAYAPAVFTTPGRKRVAGVVMSKRF